MMDAEGEVIEEADESRFLRAGRHVDVAFPVRDLSLSKFTKRDPNERDVRDAEALEFIRRAILNQLH